MVYTSKAIWCLLVLMSLLLNSNVLAFQGGKDSTFHILSNNLKKAKAQNVSIKLIAKKNAELGDYYFNSGLFTQAIAYYNDALAEAQSFKKDSLYVTLNNKLGKVYLALNNYKAAKEVFDEAFQSATASNDERGKAFSLSYLGAYSEKKAEYLDALKYQKESLFLFEKVKDNIGIATVNENIGSIYEDLTQYDKAYEYFVKSYEVFKGSNSRSEVNVLNNIGDTYRKKGNYEMAIAYTKKALDLSLFIKDNNLIESAYKDLSKAYALSGKYQEAYSSRLLSEDYGQKALIDQNLGQLNALHAEYDSKKKEAQIQLLLEQNKLNRANQKLLFIVFVSSLILIVFLGLLFWRRRTAKLKLQNYKQRMLKAELDKKAVEEVDLQKAVQLKTAALSKYSLQVAQKNKMLASIAKDLKHIANRKQVDFEAKIRTIAKDIEFSLSQESEWIEFNSLFGEVHPSFIQKLSSISDDSLTPSELKLGMLLRLNMSSKEIASILRVTPDSVRVARHRLRKKLPINPKRELVNFMLDL